METNELDFLIVQSRDWDKEFGRIAKILFNNYSIRSNDKRFDIIEVEFYYDSKEHPDPFIYDKTERNKSRGNLFFHYSGVDITFGDETNNIRGGILIRAIKDGDKYIIGPLKTMMALLNECPRMDSGKEFHFNLEPKNLKDLSSIEPDQPTIRKGLDKTKRDKYEDEATSKYRFIKSREEIEEKSGLTPSQFKQYYG
ncbi:MAG: hypothetical protein WCK84_13095 [Bacteroidota bacterium]